MRLVAALLTVLASALASAGIPRLLIVQLTEDPAKFEGYRSLVLDTYLAEALDEVGQVDPIVWSMGDPRFRQIAGDKGFPLEWESPTQPLVVNVARAVDAEYVLVVWSMRNEAVVRPVATLYKASTFRKMWGYGDWERRLAPFFSGETKPLSVAETAAFKGAYGQEIREFAGVQVGDRVDWDSTSRTIAQTWAALLRQEPFKGWPEHPKSRLPEADPGTIVPLPTGVDLPDGGMEEVEGLVAAGRVDLAIVHLRDLIDQHPFDETYRWRLVQILDSQRLYVETAQEAARGAVISKKPLPFYTVAARNWLRAGHLDSAKDALNNILARGGETRETKAMVAQLNLRTGNYSQAIEWYSMAIRSGPTPDVVYERAVAYALAGQDEACRDDLASLVDLDAKTIEESYAMAVQVCEEILQGIGVRQGDRIPLLRVRPGDQELVALAGKDLALAKSLATYLDLTPVPPRYAISHAKRKLAHKLMQQSASEIFDYATKRNEDLATEGTMSLREALALLPQIRALFAEDQSRPLP